MTRAYRILSSLAALFVLPVFALYSRITGKKRRGLAHHFGMVPRVDKTPGQKTVWVHALSLGEVNAAAPVLKRLRGERKNLKLVVSVTTDAGYDAAHRLMPFVDAIVFHPLDCWPFLKLAVGGIRPDLFILTDTGFWPGLLLLLREQGVPQMVFNGRVSERSRKRYRKFRMLTANLFNSYRVICMQSERGVDAMKHLGVQAERLHSLGDTKYDALKTMLEPERLHLREELKIPARHPVWVAGSTHPGEEALLLDAFQKLKARHPLLTLVLAPRRLERVTELEALLRNRDLNYILRSELSRNTSHGAPVIVLDTHGELARVYAVGDVAFVGNSLIPPGGGHSLIEPLAQGKPVLHGPHVENFRQAADDLDNRGLAYQVKDAEEIAAQVDALLSDPDRCAQLRDKALAYIEEHKGASRRMVEFILQELKD